MRTTLHVVIASLAIITTSTASADPQLVVGFDAELLPKVVDHETYGPTVSDDGSYGTDEPTEYALGAIAEWNVFRWLAVGVAPRYIVAPSISTQLDLRARVELGLDLHAFRLYAFGEPGYSFVFFPQQDFYMMTTSAGAFGVTFGVGARYAVKRDLAITAELGYEMMQGYGVVDPYGEATNTEQQDLLSISLGFVTPVL
jgi:hypothetical protein